MTFVCYPGCSTCAKAEKWLQAKGTAYRFRNIKLENPSAEELSLWQEKSGLELKRFFNISGMRYRELQLKDKLPGMSREEQLALLASDGMLVKRPLLVTEEKVLVGFKEKEWENLT